MSTRKKVMSAMHRTTKIDAGAGDDDDDVLCDTRSDTQKGRVRAVAHADRWAQ